MSQEKEVGYDRQDRELNVPSGAESPNNTDSGFIRQKVYLTRWYYVLYRLDYIDPDHSPRLSFADVCGRRALGKERSVIDDR